MNAQSPLAIAIKYYPISLFLMIICIGLFLLQIFTGVDASEPSNQDLIRWGANFMPYSLHNDSWRLLSSLFLHIGLLHLMFNMFALYYFGQVAERMFGSINFLILFILSGIGGNLLSNYWDLQQIFHQQPPSINAGASGGIMGIGMALLVVALSKANFNGMLLNFRSLLLVMTFNLGFGFVVSGINNAGHIGGAITGAILASIYWLQYRLNHQYFSTNAFKNPVVLLSYFVLVIAFIIIYQHLHDNFSVVLSQILLNKLLNQ